MLDKRKQESARQDTADGRSSRRRREIRTAANTELADKGFRKHADTTWLDIFGGPRMTRA
jgi:hypothetical protein